MTICSNQLCQRGEDASEEHREALLRDGLRHDGRHRTNPSDRLIRIQFVQGRACDRCIPARVIMGAQHDDHLLIGLEILMHVDLGP